MHSTGSGQRHGLQATPGSLTIAAVSVAAPSPHSVSYLAVAGEPRARPCISGSVTRPGGFRKKSWPGPGRPQGVR